MRKVLVTGCNGFIASHLVEALLEQNLEVTGVDVVPYSWPDHYLQKRSEGCFREFLGDLSDNTFVKNVYEEVLPDTVFHLASMVGVDLCMEDTLAGIEVNIKSTRNLLEALKGRKTRLVFSSSSEIYGKNPHVPWNENSNRVLGPTTVERWAYSSSKAVIEHMLWGAGKKYKLPVTVVRYFNVYGPRQRPSFVISKMVNSILSGKPVYVHDGGCQTRCFTYVKDAIKGTILAGTMSNAVGEVFNIGSNQETSIKELLQLIRKLFPEKRIEEKPINSNELYQTTFEDISRRVPNVEKAEKLLNWRAQTSLWEGVKSTVKWWQEVLNPNV